MPECAAPDELFNRGGWRAPSAFKHDTPHPHPLNCPGNRLLGARFAALREMSVGIILFLGGRKSIGAGGSTGTNALVSACKSGLRLVETALLDVVVVEKALCFRFAVYINSYINIFFNRMIACCRSCWDSGKIYLIEEPIKISLNLFPSLTSFLLLFWISSSIHLSHPPSPLLPQSSICGVFH